MDIFLKEKFAPMSSQPTNELNEHVCHKEENSWVVVFFRFFESGSFSLSFSFLFACSAVRKWRPCFVLLFFFLFVSQFRRCHAGSPILALIL